LQATSNLALYDLNNISAGPIFATDTNANTGASFVLQIDSNLVLYSGSGDALWSTGTEEDCGEQ
jgi:hypothetical protein